MSTNLLKLDGIPETIHPFLREVANIDCSIALLSQPSWKDVDVAIIGHSNSPEEVVKSTKMLVAAIKRQIGGTQWRVVNKQLHHDLAGYDQYVLHLLFYPSIEHLRYWELPSYCASLYEEAEYIFGDGKQLASFYSSYRQREILRFPILTYQLKHYADLIITSLVYIAAGQAWPSRLHLSQLLRYCLRFVLTELFVEQQLPEKPIYFWSRDALVVLCQKQFPGNLGIANALHQLQSTPRPFSDSTLEKWFFDLLLVTEIGLDAFHQYNLFPEPDFVT